MKFAERKDYDLEKAKALIGVKRAMLDYESYLIETRYTAHMQRFAEIEKAFAVYREVDTRHRAKVLELWNMIDHFQGQSSDLAERLKQSRRIYVPEVEAAAEQKDLPLAENA